MPGMQIPTLKWFNPVVLQWLSLVTAGTLLVLLLGRQLRWWLLKYRLRRWIKEVECST